MPFWGTRSELLWQYNSNQWSSPTKAKSHQTLETSQICAIQENTSTLHWFFELLPKLFTQIDNKSQSVFSIIQNNGRQRQKLDHPWHNERVQGKKASNWRCQPALRQPLPGKQLMLMTDASFQAAAYAALLEVVPEQKYTSTRKTYTPIAYGSKAYTPSQIKTSIYAKEFLANYLAFKDIGHTLWGATKPMSTMAHSKSVTRFFKTKMFPLPVRFACTYVLQFNFTIEHFPRKMNTPAELLPRLEMDPKGQRIQKNTNGIVTKPIEVKIDSRGIAQDEPVFFDSTD